MRLSKFIICFKIQNCLYPMKFNQCIFTYSLLFFLFAGAWCKAVPPGGNSSFEDGYLLLVKAYADAMIADGRDHYGAISSPLFASALDRSTMQLADASTFGSIDGIRETDRSLGGANPLWEIGLYEILYQLSEITSDPVYANEADKAIKYFFDTCQSEATGLLAWGEHLFWDFEKEACGFAARDHHEASVWPFWDKSYQLSPRASWRFAIGEWDHQIENKATGDFSRHASYAKHGPNKGSDFPRYAGQMIERWAIALNREENENQPRKEELTDAIMLMVRRMEENMHQTATGYLPALRGADYVWPTSNLELARCLTEASGTIADPLKQRMMDLAIKQDTDFLMADHKIMEGGGFAVTLHSETGVPRNRSMNKPYTLPWSTGYGYGTHAGTANLLFERYGQLKTSYPDIAGQYKIMILAAADQYLTENPDLEKTQKPDAFADVIQLMINAFQLTQQEHYRQRADYFAEMAVSLFIDAKSALPKATSSHPHYETITGGPYFMQTLLDLHLVNRDQADNN